MVGLTSFLLDLSLELRADKNLCGVIKLPLASAIGQ